MRGVKLYDFLTTHNSSTQVSAFIWIVSIIHLVAVALCFARAVLDNPNGWPWVVLFLNIFNLIILTVDARHFGLSNPLMAFIVIISESLCLAANIVICFIVSLFLQCRGVRLLTLFLCRGPLSCAASPWWFSFWRFSKKRLSYRTFCPLSYGRSRAPPASRGTRNSTTAETTTTLRRGTTTIILASSFK